MSKPERCALCNGRASTLYPAMLHTVQAKLVGYVYLCLNCKVDYDTPKFVDDQTALAREEAYNLLRKP